jgi:predicted metal-binding membrane protein
MTGMSSPQSARYAALAGFLGMWMAMMVPMMLPSLIPMLARYRRSLRGVVGLRRHGLTVLAGAGYFAVWAVLGVVVWTGRAGVSALEMRWGMPTPWPPVAAGLILLVAGGVQFTRWKARRLGRCRVGTGCGAPPVSSTLGAWSHGLELGVACSLCCGNLMLALLVAGMMNPIAMGGVTIAIAAERLAPAPLRVARVAGTAMVLLGALTIARVG